MSRGVDTSRANRDLSKAASLGIVGTSKGNQIARQIRTEQYLFGHTLAPSDNGMREGAERKRVALPGEARVPRGEHPKDIVFNQMAAPVGGDFEGAPADAIRLAQMQANLSRAMPALMEEAPSQASKAKLWDRGMSGRVFSTGGPFPVHTWVDESIKIHPEDSNADGQSKP